MTTRRTRTPSDLKFLLNERAVLTGQIRSGVRDCQPLEAEVSKLEARACMLRDQVAAIRAQQARWQECLDAVEDMLREAHPEAAPDAAGVVAAWAGKYGGRGALKTFIHSAIQASPDGISTVALVDAVIGHFHLAVATSEARNRLRHVISKRLHQSKVSGLVRAVRAETRRRQTLWFWNSGPAGDELMRLSREACCDQVSNAVRGEVGG